MKQLLKFILFIPLYTHSYVLIITHNYNRPDFIELQDKAFKKFLKDDYRYVVFNDATSEEMRKKIEETCKKLNIECIQIPQEIHSRPYLPREPNERINASIRHANVVMYSLDFMGFDHDGIVFIVDSDILLIRPFSIEKYMKDKDIKDYANVFYFAYTAIVQAVADNTLHLVTMYCIIKLMLKV